MKYSSSRQRWLIASITYISLAPVFLFFNQIWFGGFLMIGGGICALRGIMAR